MFCNLQHILLVPRKSIKIIRVKSKLSYLHNIGQEPFRPITIGLLLQETVKKHGDKEAIISRHDNKKLTFLKILEHADRIAAGLIKLGLQSGDRVGLWAPNIPEWYTTFMACARAGFVTVALNPAYQSKEMEHSIRKVGIKGLICAHKHKTQNYYEILKFISPELEKSEPGKLISKNLPSLKSVVMISDESLRGTHSFNELLDLADEGAIKSIEKNQNDVKIDDPSNIQFTSGTTGQPKAAVISQFAMVNNGYFVGKRSELGLKHHTICLQVPFFHAFGTIGGIMSSLSFGSTLVLPTPGYDPTLSLDSLKEERCTIITGTPTMYVDLIGVQKKRKEQLHAEIAVSGGASCSPHLFKEMLNVLGLKKVRSVYGLSEITGVAFQSLSDDDESKSTNTVGYLQDHLEAKVVDENGRIVPTGTPGELCIRSYGTMLGYWDDEEKTREMIDSARWLKTGDQFILNENGYGSVVGRLKQLIIRGGENIFPKEIEDLLDTHPNILEAHVVGLPHERLGEEVCACVKLKENSSITLDEIKQFCKGKISHFKVPSVIKIVDTFPKTTSGKVQKFELVKLVQK